MGAACDEANDTGATDKTSASKPAPARFGALLSSVETVLVIIESSTILGAQARAVKSFSAISS
jgi:hypothetical protein